MAWLIPAVATDAEASTTPWMRVGTLSGHRQLISAARQRDLRYDGTRTGSSKMGIESRLPGSVSLVDLPRREGSRASSVEAMVTPTCAMASF
jgi:hypothetical protein